MVHEGHCPRKEVNMTTTESPHKGRQILLKDRSWRPPQGENAADRLARAESADLAQSISLSYARL
jgi:hypothetical protein